MILTFPTECTIESMEEIKASLLAALQGDSPIELSFQQVERADLSFFQLLHVAKESFQEAGKALIFHPDLAPRFAFKAAATHWSQLVVTPPSMETQPPATECP